jgi:predicted RNA-binding Zn-ribbon protein involved in translation (DUF1610 family)
MTEKKSRRQGADNPQYTCHRCGVALEPMPVKFSYLKRGFQADVPRCPKCGLVYIPEDLARGRMSEVERQMESK